MTAPTPSPQPPVPRLPELLAPAGNWACAKAAVENGADAIYFGLERFNARMRSQNFTVADLPDLMAFLHQRGVKGYVTLNTLIFPAELAEVDRYLRTMIQAGVDAVIVQDLGICRLIRHLSPDFPIHASTQMTITSAIGVELARSLGCQLVVLARECSLRDIRRIQTDLAARDLSLPLEVFVHGALCVAYSGQCLTSEALGGRSANRGECAQACRMPYDLIVDGQVHDLGDRQYLLSPQDLCGLDVLPDLVQTGVTSLKIEGRLKSPEYVANITQVYRHALDRLARSPQPFQISAAERYQLEMGFSRGLYTGWFQGIDNQALVHARFGKKRGVYLGEVTRLIPGQYPQISLRSQAPIQPGDGVVFDQGQPDQPEEGGRVYQVTTQAGETILAFGKGDLNLRRLQVGAKVWKTSDPDLDRRLRQSYAGDQPRTHVPLYIAVSGAVGTPLTLVARDAQGHQVTVTSELAIAPAINQPLTTERLTAQLGRLGQTVFYLAGLDNQLQGAGMLPLSELNRLRRLAVEALEAQRRQPQRWTLQADRTYQDLLPVASAPTPAIAPELIVLIRRHDQLAAALATGIRTLYAELEDPRAYLALVQAFRQHQTSDQQTLWVAPPRITKPAETYILDQVRRSQADGYLVRNYDHLHYFAGDRQIADFSLNVANPLTAAYLMTTFGLERLTASYDLNLQQLSDLLTTTPPAWLEVTIHQHMPMFHMEHCVFCAFLSDGTDFTNCGRPCDTATVKLRDRVGTEHILQADAGCRNTVFNGTAQTGAEGVHTLLQLGLRYLRLEFLDETPTQVTHTIQRYQALLAGTLTGAQLWRELHLQSQLGVTRGSWQARAGSTV